jgi:hypothetical protein
MSGPRGPAPDRTDTRLKLDLEAETGRLMYETPKLRFTMPFTLGLV